MVMKKRIYYSAVVSLIFTSLSAAAIAAPKADIHLHYKWNQAEVTSLEKALEILDKNEIELAAVIGTPPELALQFQEKAKGRVFPWYGVYRNPGDWSRWAFDPATLTAAKQAVTDGGYEGIGELHLIGGFVPSWSTPVISGLLNLSAEQQIPLLLHVEFSRANYLIGLCQHEPKSKLLLAHAGAPMLADEVRRALNACPNLWWELSARDPLRYVDSKITDEKGVLLSEWKSLILDYSDRLMLGSDPVWPVEQLNPWDEPDTGWDQIENFWAAHEGWLAQLPEKIAGDIRLNNAKKFFKITDK